MVSRPLILLCGFFLLAVSGCMQTRHVETTRVSSWDLCGCPSACNFTSLCWGLLSSWDTGSTDH